MSVEIIRVPKAPPVGLGQGNMLQSGEAIDAYVVQQLQGQGFALLNPRRSARLAAVPRRSYTGLMDEPGAYGWLYFKNTAQESKLQQAKQAAAASRRAKKAASAEGEVSMDADSAPAAAAAAATSSKPAPLAVASTDDEEELSKLFAGLGRGGRRRKHRTRKSRKTRHRRTRRSTRA
jgi:hypothetical protein